MEGEIINRVASSSLITFDLEEYFDNTEVELLDIKNWLFQEQILKERDFRNSVKEHDWSQYQNKHVVITCSIEAIIPTWAYMLITINLEPYAKRIVVGKKIDLYTILFNQSLRNIDLEKYRDAKVVIKGCSKIPVPQNAYVEITRILRPVASSIMYGEPCSTVPLYKKQKK